MSSSPFRPPRSRRRLRRRSATAWLLIAAFIVVPILEIYVIIQVGQVIGAWWTIVLLIADSIFGSWLVRREGDARGRRSPPRSSRAACPPPSSPTVRWSWSAAPS